MFAAGKRRYSPEARQAPPVCPQLVPRDNAGARCGLDTLPRRLGERTVFEGSAERNVQEAVAAREARDLPKLRLVIASSGLIE